MVQRGKQMPEGFLYQDHPDATAQTPGNFCPSHPDLVKGLGKIEGMLSMVLSGQKTMQTNIEDLYKMFHAGDKQNAIQDAKISPVFWVIAIIGGYILLELVKGLFKR